MLTPYGADPFDTSATAMAVLRIAALYLVIAAPLRQFLLRLQSVPVEEGARSDIQTRSSEAEGRFFGVSALLAGLATFWALVVASGGGIATDPISLGANSVALSLMVLGIVSLAAPARVAAMNQTRPSVLMPIMGLACLALTFLAH
jgi:hypothetical protein